MIPAVTYHEDADITDLEAFRVRSTRRTRSRRKITMLAFLIKACVALKKFPSSTARSTATTWC
jgi:pyruvate dehydrogenase E2 component (dihydrolipoamide acetyltransferase)